MFKLVAIVLLAALVHSAPTDDEIGNVRDCTSPETEHVVYRDTDGQLKSFDARPVCYPATPEDENVGELKPLKGVNLDLYTNDNPDEFKILPTNIDQAKFIKDVPTVALIHGWLEKGTKAWVLDTKDDMVKTGKYNVIAVDWQALAIEEYNISAYNTKLVGEYLGKILSLLINAGSIDADNIHIVGHSLGAHIAGVAGSIITQNTTKVIGRITALDAAGPGFVYPLVIVKNKRVDKTDAKFLVAIHSDGGIFGILNSYGHVDFYPNGGTEQTGCLAVDVCNHQRSCYLFEDSVITHSLVGRQCGSWSDYKAGKCDSNPKQEMGLYTTTDAKGDYYLKTNSKAPFGEN